MNGTQLAAQLVPRMHPGHAGGVRALPCDLKNIAEGLLCKRPIAVKYTVRASECPASSCSLSLISLSFMPLLA